jgi:hypothetical protein
MIKTTRRRLETCDCIIEYSWDDEVAPDSIVISNPKTINKCVEHSHLANGNEHIDQIFSEDLQRLAALQNG